MKSEKLLSLIGEIDDKFIEEAAMPYKRKPHYIRYGALAASFIFLVLVAISGFGRGMRKSAGFDGSFVVNNFAPETAYDDKNLVADSTTTQVSHEDADDESSYHPSGNIGGISEYAYGYYATVIKIDTENRIITLKFNEKNDEFGETIDIKFDSLKDGEKIEDLSVNENVELLVSKTETFAIIKK